MSDRIQAKLVACPRCSEVFPPSELEPVKQTAEPEPDYHGEPDWATYV